MTKNNYDACEKLYQAFVSVNDSDECKKLLDDLCTINEIQAMVQRLEVAKMLKEGKKFADIAVLTGASTATISRVSRCLNYGSGGYSIVLDRIGDNNE